MVNASELLWAVLALQLAALFGIGGLIYTQAELKATVATHSRRLKLLERQAQ